jgi:hypothetical protein
MMWHSARAVDPRRSISSPAGNDCRRARRPPSPPPPPPPPSSQTPNLKIVRIRYRRHCQEQLPQAPPAKRRSEAVYRFTPWSQNTQCPRPGGCILIAGRTCRRGREVPGAWPPAASSAQRLAPPLPASSMSQGRHWKGRGVKRHYSGGYEFDDGRRKRA